MIYKMRNFRLGMLVPAALAACLLFSPPARADFIFSLESGITASQGSTGNVFDVLLTNTGGMAVTVGGFSWDITTANTDITFTNADTSPVTPYIFTSDSFDNDNSFPLFTNSLPGQEVAASDFSDASGDSVGAGATVGVGRVMFDIANGATTGPFAVTFQDLSGTNSLSDNNGGGLPFTTQDGTITITSTTTVPEPSQGGLIICALAGFAILLQRRRT
jgi:hypothetical protein